MNIEILGWSYENIRRFGKLNIDLRQDGSSLPHVCLVMMRNGTGKTTTIQLIRAVLNGAATSWNAQQVREFRPKGQDVSFGKFNLTIKFDGNTYYYTLLFDYDRGKAEYQTSRVSSIGGGLEGGRILPTTLNGVFDVEEFVNRFIFDGEQARKTLNSSSTEAENAVKYLYQVDKLDRLIDKVNESVRKRQIEGSRGASQQSVRNNRTRMENKKRRLAELEQELAKVQNRVQECYAQKKELDAEKERLLRSDSKIREKTEKLKAEQADETSNLIGHFAAIKARMREPYRVNPIFDQMLRELADNMQTLKLPKTTAREFFRELSMKQYCICGRPISPVEKSAILSNAEEYLGEEDLVAINAIKDRIRNYEVSDELQEAVKAMVRTKDTIEEISGALQRLTLQLNGEDQQKIKRIEEELRQVGTELGDLEQKEIILTTTAGIPGINENTNIPLAKKAYEEARANFNTALGTYEYTQKADKLTAYLAEIRSSTLDKLKATIVQKTNEKVEQIVTDEHIVVERIDGSLVLQGRAGASEGQTLAIAYAYICSLFEHSAYHFPFVVDSPAASMDLDVRREVASVIPRLFDQLIIFVTSGEVAGFAERMYQRDDVLYMTIEGEHDGAAAKCTIGKDYFSTYQSEEGDE